MPKRVTVNGILEEIGNEFLTLNREKDHWRFIYDDETSGIFETTSIFVRRLNHLSFTQWVELGEDFIKFVELKNFD